MEQGKVFIEGLPCAGKSLLVKALQENGNHVVHELGRVLPRGSFPGDGKNADEIEKINEWFIDRESDRITNNTYGYFDRSFFTHLVYAYAYEKFSGIESFHRTIDQYQIALDERRLTLPDKVIYIYENPSISIERQLFKISIGRVALASFWRDEIFLRDTIVGYTALLESLSGVNTIILDAEMTTEEKLSKLKKDRLNKCGKKSIDLVAFGSTK